MLDQLLDQLDPILADALYVSLLGLVTGTGWFGITLKRLLETKQAQASLHMALETGVDWATDQFVAMLNGKRDHVSEETITDAVVDYVRGSVPGALKTLGPDQEQLKRMATAKVNARFYEHIREEVHHFPAGMPDPMVTPAYDEDEDDEDLEVTPKKTYPIN